MIRSFTIALLLSSYFSNAQLNKIHFEQFGVKEGLSNNQVMRFLKDSEGYVWIGTAAGLNRHNAYDFEVWYHDPLDSISLSHNRIYDLFEDSKQRIWIGTANGLNQFDKKTEKFIRYEADMKDSLALSNGTVLSIDEDKNGFLWIATYGGGLNKLDPVTGVFTAYMHDKEDTTSIRQNYTMSVLVDTDNIVWVGLAGWGLNRFDPINEEFRHFVFDIGYTDHNIDNNAIRTLHEDNYGQLWMGTEGGLNLFNKKKLQYTNHYEPDPNNAQSLPSKFIVRIFEDDKENFWLASTKGLVHFNPKSARSTNLDESSAALNDNIYDFLFEKNGTIWLSTITSGFYKGNLHNRPFDLEVNTDSKYIDLGKNRIKKLFLDDRSRICISTPSGLAISDPGSQETIELTTNNESIVKLSDNSILCVFQDSQGIYWVGTDNHGLDRINLEKKTIKNYRHDPLDSTTIGDKTVSSILEDDQGNIWVGVFGGGLNKFDEKTGTFRTFLPESNNKFSISDHRVTSLLFDSKKNLWVGTINGLNKFNVIDETFVSLYTSDLGEQGISQNEVEFIFEDSKQKHIWVGTKGGLDKLTYEGTKLKSYTKKDGLASNQVLSVTEDDSGFLWIGTNRGISRFDSEAEIFKNYDTSNGLPEKAFSSGSALNGGNGKLYFGNAQGLISFYPDQIKNNNTVPPIVITNFKVINELEDASSNMIKVMVLDGEISLSHKRNVFSIEFAALNYVASEKNQYAYKMEGFDNNWIQSYTRRSTTYTNLDAGNYTFRVKGSNNDGVWNDEGTSIKITILPPWWKTWWAYSGYSAIFLGLILYFRQNLIKEERLQATIALEKMELNKMKEFDESKTKFFTNISHDLRTPLTLILGPLKDIIRNKNRGDQQMFKMMYRNGQTLLRLINQLLDAAKLQSGKLKLNASKGDIIQFSRQIFYSFESSALQKRITWKFEAKTDITDFYFDQDKMSKILTNLLSNALKFTAEEGKVVLSLTERKEQVSLVVKDTGIGIATKDIPHIFDRFYQVESNPDSQYLGTGIGLALVKELVDLHSGTIEVQSVLGQGTEFKILFPIGSSHFNKSEIVEASSVENEVLLTDGIQEEHVRISEPLENTKNPILLLVEDNSDMRMYIRNNLENNYFILEAKDGNSGLLLASDHIPDIIVSDVMMPEMNGFEFCEKIKTDEKTSHIPVILLTARATEGDKLEGLETGADAYMTKPFNTEELKIRIEKLIEQRTSLREKFSRKIVISPSEVSVVSADERFLSRAIQMIEKHISDSEFDVERFGREIGLSRVQLYRKLKALTNLSATEFIRNIRLKRAAQLIKQKSGTVAEIAYKVGFTDHSYFSKRFKETFGITPSEYLEKPDKQSM